MKHKKKGRKFGRKRDQRRALLRGLAGNLILKEKITTTEAKAKELRPFVEKLITKSKSAAVGKKDNLSVVRELSKNLPTGARKKLVSQIGSRYKERPGGYTRIVKIGPRKADSAKMAIIELIK